MRIISGIAKGRKLIQLKSKSIRPTTDRVKETIFNILARDVSGASVLDLFAGTGNLGLEALSRGAMLVDFVERSYNSIEVIKKNMKLTKLKGNIIKKNALEYIKTSAFSYDIIFADPPYNNGFVNKILYAIHFNPDILGNLRKFCVQEFRCIKCNTKFRRPPLSNSGKCPKCNNRVILTVNRGGIEKYIPRAVKLCKDFNMDGYTIQKVELISEYVESLTNNPKVKQQKLSDFF